MTHCHINYSSNKRTNQQSNYNAINFLLPIFFLSLPFIFTFVLNFFLLSNQFNDKKMGLDEYDNFADEMIYNHILEKNNTDLEINSLNKILLSKDTQYISKFEEVIQNYRNNFSTHSLSLKNDNLLVNYSKKKNKFIKTILPLTIHQNQKILAQRQRLIEIKNYLNLNKTLPKESQKFYENLSSEYLVVSKNRHKIDVINDLLILVDIIPNSIVLAQAANESGWGSSRFTVEYNALFGQYTYDDKEGVIPLQRDKGEKHLIRYFSSFDKSVESYFNNINSHYAYSEFRKLRKLLRDQNNLFNPLYASLLVNKLNVYADDNNYVDIINSIIKVNKLTQFDNTKYLITNL